MPLIQLNIVESVDNPNPVYGEGEQEALECDCCPNTESEAEIHGLGACEDGIFEVYLCESCLRQATLSTEPQLQTYY